jgi:hypothetical protein
MGDLVIYCMGVGLFVVIALLFCAAVVLAAQDVYLARKRVLLPERREELPWPACRVGEYHAPYAVCVLGGERVSVKWVCQGKEHVLHFHLNMATVHGARQRLWEEAQAGRMRHRDATAAAGMVEAIHSLVVLGRPLGAP